MLIGLLITSIWLEWSAESVLLDFFGERLDDPRKSWIGATFPVDRVDGMDDRAVVAVSEVKADDL